LAKDESAHGSFGWLIREEVMPDFDDRSRAHLRKVAARPVARLESRAIAHIVERLGA
jgi:hypothetical protein